MRPDQPCPNPESHKLDTSVHVAEEVQTLGFGVFRLNFSTRRLAQKPGNGVEPPKA